MEDIPDRIPESTGENSIVGREVGLTRHELWVLNCAFNNYDKIVEIEEFYLLLKFWEAE